MPPSAEAPQTPSSAPLADVERELSALEQLCGTLERALMQRNWKALETAMADSRRITHALANAMDDARSVRSSEFDAATMRRIRYVEAIRQNQLARLKQYRDSIGERLALTAKWKSALRSMERRRRPSRLASLDVSS